MRPRISSFIDSVSDSQFLLATVAQCSRYQIMNIFRNGYINYFLYPRINSSISIRQPTFITPEMFALYPLEQNCPEYRDPSLQGRKRALPQPLSMKRRALASADDTLFCYGSDHC
ncbi:hypothetical protein TNCV_921811 [Trichonephila clavipes]|nr:hypothetical protein TNCV_921811 [Trichonephila clavipes]